MIRGKICSALFRLGGVCFVSVVTQLLLPAVLMPLRAQQPVAVRSVPSTPVRPFSLGGYAGVESTRLTSDFAVDSSGFIEQGECGKFESGDGSGGIVGLTFGFVPFDGIRVLVQPELRFGSSTLSYLCVDPARTRLPDGSVVAAETIFKTELATRVLSLRLMLSRSMFDLPLDFSIGPVLSMSLGGEFESWEEISTPREAEFVSGGQVRNIASGRVDGGDLSVALGGGIAWRARIGESLELIPELGYTIDLGTHDAPIDLGVRALRGTLGILYSLQPPSAPPVLATPLPVSQPPALRAALSINSLDPSGRPGDTLEYSIRRTISTRLHPLLTYLFFDEGVDTIDRRYVRRGRGATERFSEAHLESESVLETYHNVLDIIGSRLRSNPGASVTITGTQPENDGSALTLARSRADNVAHYLTDEWSIEPSRLRVVARGRPQTASNEETTEGRQENRRVEITSDTYDIIAPVLLADTASVAVASGLRLMPSTPDSARVAGWRLDLGQNQVSLLSLDGSGAPPAQITRPSLSLATGSAAASSRLDAQLTLRDAAGNEVVARESIPVRHHFQQDTIDYGAGQYSLILFDFGRAALRPEHQRIVELINSRTPRGSTSTVAGFTDRLGEAELNLDLSRQRATTVARTLNGPVDKVLGEGESRLLYDNDLPEGRFYSRCVTVEVKVD